MGVLVEGLKTAAASEGIIFSSLPQLLEEDEDVVEKVLQRFLENQTDAVAGARTIRTEGGIRQVPVSRGPGL